MNVEGIIRAAFEDDDIDSWKVLSDYWIEEENPMGELVALELSDTKGDSQKTIDRKIKRYDQLVEEISEIMNQVIPGFRPVEFYRALVVAAEWYWPTTTIPDAYPNITKYVKRLVYTPRTVDKGSLIDFTEGKWYHPNMMNLLDTIELRALKGMPNYLKQKTLFPTEVENLIISGCADVDSLFGALLDGDYLPKLRNLTIKDCQGSAEFMLLGILHNRDIECLEIERSNSQVGPKLKNFICKEKDTKEQANLYQAMQAFLPNLRKVVWVQ